VALVCSRPILADAGQSARDDQNYELPDPLKQCRNDGVVSSYPAETEVLWFGREAKRGNRGNASLSMTDLLRSISTGTSTRIRIMNDATIEAETAISAILAFPCTR
jgi:hypothetical protein